MIWKLKKSEIEYYFVVNNCPDNIEIVFEQR